MKNSLKVLTVLCAAGILGGCGSDDDNRKPVNAMPMANPTPLATATPGVLPLPQSEAPPTTQVPPQNIPAPAMVPSSEASEKLADAQYDQRRLGLGQWVFESSVNNGRQMRSVDTFVSCSDSVHSAIINGKNGIQILKGSKILFHKPESPKPFSVVTCESRGDKRYLDLSQVSGRTYEKKSLRFGESTEELAAISPVGSQELLQSTSFSVVCLPGVVHGSTSPLNGIILTGGSTLVVIRDTSQEGLTGRHLTRSAPYSIITCE